MSKRKSDIKEGSRKERKNVMLSQRLIDHTKDKNRSEALEEAYWAMNKDIKENGNEK